MISTKTIRAAWLTTALLAIAAAAHAQLTAEPISTLHITVGRSTVLTTAAPLKRIYVGNPAVLQSFNAAPTEVVLTAKIPGTSSLVLWDTAARSTLYTIQADIDPTALRAALHSAFPLDNITAEAAEARITLTGSTTSPETREAATKLAAIYSKEIANSIQLLPPPHAKQVQLKLRIVEVDRTKMQQFGINIFGAGNNPFAAGTQQFASAATTTTTTTVADALNLFAYSTHLNAGVTIKDLEQKDILQILAEPTLTTISGLPARFHSGGEFPFPVVQGGTGAAAAITIMFRPYGVKMDFTPTVNSDGTIRLKIIPEVSTLDFSNAVTISGFTIPALSTRRAETEVELRDGQSFILTGLLDHRTTESLSKVPGISSIPILGRLFNSKSFQHSVVELVVIVTATVVDPLAADPTPIAEPAPVVPFMDVFAYDKQLHRQEPAHAK